jgi:hypothetical protein
MVNTDSINNEQKGRNGTVSCHLILLSHCDKTS